MFKKFNKKYKLSQSFKKKQNNSINKLNAKDSFTKNKFKKSNNLKKKPNNFMNNKFKGKKILTHVNSHK